MTGVVVRGFRVTGRVQGVGFRWWSRGEAERLRLAGAVWNREDGAVEVHVVGSPADVEEFRRVLEEGPAAARVDGVEEVEGRGDLASTEFRVLR